MVLSRSLAEYAWILQPVSIRRRLLSRREFIERFELKPPAIIGVGRLVGVDREDFFAAVRRMLSSGSEQRLQDVRGREIIITRTEHGVVVKGTPGTDESLREVVLADLLILSSNPQERLAALDTILSRLGPTAPNLWDLRLVVGERELSDEETSALTEEMSNGVAARHERAISSIRANQATLDMIVPASVIYYERLCGPDPHGASVEDYVTGVLASSRRELLRRDLAQGLDICLLGFLRDDLSPATWTDGVGDEEMWAALNACNFRHDPFSLLGALDVALWRQHDSRFADLAGEVMVALTNDDLARRDGVDGYVLQSLFAECTLNRLCTLEGAAYRPPYWRRMCAWMQAGLLLRWTEGIAIDLEHLKEWIRNQLTAAGSYVKLMDLRREPMFRAGETSRQALRNEVIGRLMQIRRRHQDAGRVNPRFHSIDEAVTRLAKDVGLLVGGSPGPLEGHLRARDFGPRQMPGSDIAEIEEALSADPSGWVWSAIADLSQHFDLRLQGSIVLRAREATTNVVLEGEGRGEALARLSDGALAAAALRDTELAKAIWSRVVSYSHLCRSDEEVARILRLLLLASASFEDERVWSEWLENQLTQLASQLPAARAAYLRLEFGDLRKALPWTQGILSRAVAVASAAA